MYIVKTINSTGEVLLQLGSIAEVQRWSIVNGLVLGEPQIYVPVYSIEHLDGSELDAETLYRLQPEDSETLYDRRQHEAREFIAGRKIPRTPQNFNSLYAGAAHAAIMKHNGRQQEKHINDRLRLLKVVLIQSRQDNINTDWGVAGHSNKFLEIILVGTVGKCYICPIPDGDKWEMSLVGVGYVNSSLVATWRSPDIFTCAGDLQAAINDYNRSHMHNSFIRGVFTAPSKGV